MQCSGRALRAADRNVMRRATGLPSLRVTVDWFRPDQVDDAGDLCHCLYAYLGPPSDEILYIGKSWGVSVQQRWVRSAKPAFWADLERERGIRKHRPIVGLVQLSRAARLNRKLLADIESLLIYAEKPWGNIQSQASRIRRPGLLIQCRGDWPGRKVYRDE